MVDDLIYNYVYNLPLLIHNNKNLTSCNLWIGVDHSILITLHLLILFLPLFIQVIYLPPISSIHQSSDMVKNNEHNTYNIKQINTDCNLQNLNNQNNLPVS